MGGLDDGVGAVGSGHTIQGGTDVHDDVIDAAAVEIVEQQVARLEGARAHVGELGVLVGGRVGHADTPAWAQASRVRPEQSTPLELAPPQT